MPEFERVLPENIAELEPLGKISILRQIVYAYKLDGTPVVRTGGFAQPNTVKYALEWISSTSDSNSLYEVTIPLAGVGLAGGLIEDDKGEKYLSLSSTSGKSGMSPVAVSGEYLVKPWDDDFLHIIVILDEDQSDTFFKGAAFLELSRNSWKSLRFALNPNYYTVDALADEMTKMLKRMNVVINKLLNGFDTDYK